MLPTLLSAVTLLPLAVDPPARLQAAAELEAALESAATAEKAAVGALRAGIAQARELLGSESEVADALQDLAHGARFEALFAADDGAAWLAERVASVAADLRFEPVLEADTPQGFPSWTPVGEIEIKRYPAYRAARTAMGGANGQGAFWKLFGHIQQNDIAMTAPVETTFDAHERELVETSMAFLYASQALGETGAQDAVDVIDVAARAVVSIGLRGVERPERIAAARSKLERWIDVRPRWRATGPVRTLGYNSPRVRGDRRYFEVQIPVTKTIETVIDFAAEGEVSRWQSVDDVVMGGVSASRLIDTNEASALFTGELSLANNGGFASVRTRGERCSLAGASSVILRVRGDGKDYRLRCLAATRLGEISYQATFATRAGAWTDVELELADFEPRWRGRLITDAPALDPAAVLGLGLMVADKQAGPFRLELESLVKVLDATVE